MGNRLQNISIHLLGCILFLSIPVIFSPDNNDLVTIFSVTPFQREFLSSVLLLLFFYINYYVLMPQFYVTKQFFYFSIWVIVGFLVITFLPSLLIVGHQPPPNAPTFDHNPPPRPPRGMSVLFFLQHHVLEFLIVFIFSMLLHIRERLKKTETEKANAELQYLKAQINPHFLFNTLNSIYSLAIIKSDKTANAIIKLSDMMRYVLNDSQHNFVLLEKEIKYISSYIELQRMRLTSNVQLNYTCEGNIHQQKIAPLVLIPFIENAFKHGVNSEENSNIDIQITITDTTVNLQVKNNCVTTNNNTLNKSGFGIQNTKERLSFLYPQQHTLNISHTGTVFIVNLTLNIHD